MIPIQSETCIDVEERPGTEAREEGDDESESALGEAALGDDVLARVIDLLQAEQGLSFALYRRSTIARRVLRRMELCRAPGPLEYLRLLGASPAERAALHREVLVKVTSFFRDPEVFASLAQLVLPALVRERALDTPLRIWVPGCATGEEVYSIGILLAELYPDNAAPPAQLFATDADEEAIEAARDGRYPGSIALDVSPERLARFFRRDGDGFRVSRALRDRCVFARHDLARDPPFGRLDLISCRNVLIYFEPALQKKTLEMFHFALRPEGALLLGPSETADAAPGRFAALDRKGRIFRRVGGEPEGAAPFTVRRLRPKRPPSFPDTGAPSAFGEADRLLLRRYAPAAVILDADLRIVEFRGETGPYLRPAPGEPSLHVLKMAREGLGIELRAALQRAKRTGEPVRVEGLTPGDDRQVAIEVSPLGAGEDDDDPPERFYLVVFEETPAPPVTVAPDEPPGPVSQAASRRIAQLERDLAAARAYLTRILEEHEATNEELASANEELAAGAEALESINEALTASRDELSAANAELAATNRELCRRIAELADPARTGEP